MSEPEFFLPFLKRKIKPEVLHAIRVILEAIFEESSCSSVERERHERDVAEQRERIRRAERGVATRRRNAKKKKKVGGVKKKRPAKPDEDRALGPRCRAVSFTGERCTRHGSHAGRHEAKSGHWLSPIRHRCHYQMASRRCLLHQGHDGGHALVARPATKGSKRK